MGSSIIPERTVGNLVVKNKVGELFLDCPSPVRFSIIVQDEVGKKHFEETTQHPAGQHTLTFHFEDLPSGTYNAWIEAEGKTYLRPFTIPPSDNPGFLGRVVQLFS
ncbi:MAG: hypothetical protein R2830_06750 [Saprospiraceae bacterium]